MNQNTDLVQARIRHVLLGFGALTLAWAPWHSSQIGSLTVAVFIAHLCWNIFLYYWKKRVANNEYTIGIWHSISDLIFDAITLGIYLYSWQQGWLEFNSAL